MQNYDKRFREMDNNRILPFFRIFSGTLTQIMWFTEGFLMFALTFILARIFHFDITLTIILLIFVPIIILILLAWWAFYIKKGIVKETNNLFQPVLK